MKWSLLTFDFSEVIRLFYSAEAKLAVLPICMLPPKYLPTPYHNRFRKSMEAIR